MADEILQSVIVGLVTSWIIGVSTYIARDMVVKHKIKKDLDAAHRGIRKHLAKEHGIVRTDNGRSTGTYSPSSDYEASDHTNV